MAMNDRMDDPGDQVLLTAEGMVFRGIRRVGKQKGKRMWQAMSWGMEKGAVLPIGGHGSAFCDREDDESATAR